MNWKELGSDVAKIAPILGTALCGPFGGIVGSAIGGLLGVSPNPDVIRGRLNQPATVSALQSYESLNVSELEALAENDSKQLAIESTHANSANVFIAGAQPFVVWSCGAIVLFNGLIAPISDVFLSHPLPTADTGAIISAVLVLLGHGAQKTFEKWSNKNVS